ncbi:GumC family protein [Sphingomonas floccifaciens]|uniref:GumC family protein n=1 Tax=Sphingomonas floccifaciens TaxID=1844115 RepID=A0ABW4NAB9_9SPHN
MNEVTVAAEEEGGGSDFFSQLPAILRARKWWIIVPLVLGIVAALAAIYFLPRTYRSTAVILVQSPKLPGDVVGATPGDNVDRRILRIEEQVTSRPALLELIEQHSLYASERARKPLSEIVEKMRSNIALTPVTGNTASDPNAEKTISFTLSFDYDRPAEAQAVTQDLMTRILELDASQNTAQATGTVQFLADQSNELQSKISQLEGQISAISARNGRALSNATPILGGSGGMDVQIAQLQRENALLQAQRRSLASSDDRDPLVVAAEAQLAAARAVYSDTHPDVIFARQRVREARAAAQAKPKTDTTQAIDQQIALNNAQIGEMRAAKSRDMAQVASSISAQAQGPLAEQQIAQLQQRLTGLNDQKKLVDGRLLAARAGARADDEQMGQRLSIVEPPVVPDKPHSPNRYLLAGAGPGGGLLLGLVLALAIELIRRPVRGLKGLTAILGEPPMAAIPVIPAKPTKSVKPGSKSKSRRGFFSRLLRRRPETVRE